MKDKEKEYNNLLKELKELEKEELSNEDKIKKELLINRLNVLKCELEK